MRKLLNSIKEQFSSFILGRDDLAMVLGAKEADSMPLLSILEDVEAEQASDFFWTFTDSYTDDKSYVQSIVDLFSTKHQAVVLSQEKEHMKVWPEIPSDIVNKNSPPAKRLRKLAVFSRGLLPIKNGGVIVWTYFPLQVSDWKAYSALMSSLTEHEFPNPWCHHIRFIVRDDVEEMVVTNAFQNKPRIILFAPDFSHEAINKSMDEELEDPNISLDEKMPTLLVSAGNDISTQRYPESLEKLALLLQYHGSRNNYLMSAVSLQLMGEAYHRMGKLDDSNKAYESALIPASKGENPSPQVLINITIGLAELRETQKRWDEAEGYWDCVQDLSAVTRDAPLKARAFERRGFCQKQQEKNNEAEKSWKASTVVSAQLEDSDSCVHTLDTLSDHYETTNQPKKKKAIDNYISSFDES